MKCNKRLIRKRYTIKKTLKEGVWFNEDNKPAIINGIAQYPLKLGDILYFYGDTL